MQLVAVGEAVHVADLLALNLDCQRGTGVDRPPVNDHRAGAAGAPVASALIAREIRAHAQCIEQCDSAVSIK